MARAAPASAHGIGGRGDLPLPTWQVAWSAGFAVAMSFIALGLLWTAPRLARAAEGRPVPGLVGHAIRVVGEVGRWLAVALFVLVLVDAW